jgi:Asp-tRNA(Asn)/Glu-tRNA(Gln) amidotransferase A subunit family amidase
MLLSNMAGYPCVVVPNAQKTGSNPASICFLGKLFGEAEAVAVASAYQSLTTFHRQRPKLEP